MEASELLSIVAAGESSKVQFKREISHNDALAAEMVAMANTKGGIILIGVEDKTGKLSGIYRSPELNDRIANIASNHVSPPIFVTTEIISIAIREDKKYILSIHVSEGINKPYKDKSGTIWVKQGADKRKLLDNAEILKLFQSGRNLSADEMEIFGTSIEDVDEKQFSKYFVQEFGRSFQDYGFNLAQALKAKRILLSDQLTLAGLLFFSKAPQQFKPAFTIKVVSFFGNDIGSNSYRSKPKDLEGTIPELFNKAIDFIMSNIHHLQSGDSFNSPGKPEISRLAL
ncbi:MAG: helix-turn-helix domain-containing protein, partial [bacterium]